MVVSEELKFEAHEHENEIVDHCIAEYDNLSNEMQERIDSGHYTPEEMFKIEHDLALLGKVLGLSDLIP